MPRSQNRASRLCTIWKIEYGGNIDLFSNFLAINRTKPRSPQDNRNQNLPQNPVQKTQLETKKTRKAHLRMNPQNPTERIKNHTNILLPVPNRTSNQELDPPKSPSHHPPPSIPKSPRPRARTGPTQPHPGEWIPTKYQPIAPIGRIEENGKVGREVRAPRSRSRSAVVCCACAAVVVVVRGEVGW